jgi:hypothetical protein
MPKGKPEIPLKHALFEMYCPLIKEECKGYRCVFWFGNLQKGDCGLREIARFFRDKQEDAE